MVGLWEEREGEQDGGNAAGGVVGASEADKHLQGALAVRLMN